MSSDTQYRKSRRGHADAAREGQLETYYVQSLFWHNGARPLKEQR